MMKLTSREYSLAILTVAAILGAVTATLGLDHWKALKDTREQRERMIASRLAFEQRVARKPQIQQRVDELWSTIPKYPAELDVSADLLRKIEGLASENSLTLTRREPEKERALGNLFEVSIHANWEGSLDALVHFLYAVQTQGAMFDTRQLTINPPRSGSSALTGTFTIDCAYTRNSSGAGRGTPPAASARTPSVKR